MLACHNTDMEASDNKMADGFMTLPEVIQTPCGPFNGVTAPDGHTICAVDRSGALVMNLLPSRKMSKATHMVFQSSLMEGAKIRANPEIPSESHQIGTSQAHRLFPSGRRSESF